MCDTCAIVGAPNTKKRRNKQSAIAKNMPSNRMDIMQQVICLAITPTNRNRGWFPMSTSTEAPNSSYKKDMKKATKMLMKQWIKHGVSPQFCEWGRVRNTIQSYLRGRYMLQIGTSPDEEMMPMLRMAAMQALHGTPVFMELGNLSTYKCRIGHEGLTYDCGVVDPVY